METGRQHVQRDFWESADAAVSAGGSLVAAYDKLDEMARQARAGITQTATTPEPVTLPVVYAAGRPLPGAGSGSATPASMSAHSDAIALAAGQARDHAANAAATGIGPGTLEQLTAEVVRLGRCLCLRRAASVVHRDAPGLGRVQAALDQKAYPSQARDLNFLAGRAVRADGQRDPGPGP